jgi:vacuolar protein sorting-associated protein 72
MADDNEDTPMRTEEGSSDSDSGSGSESEEEQIEWLVTTREKRSTAGNRLASILQQEEPDDELELLFAEADDDAGFEDVDEDSDVQMDSSDDDED